MLVSEVHESNRPTQNGDLLTHWTHLTLPCQGKKNLQGNHCVEVKTAGFQGPRKKASGTHPRLLGFMKSVL